MAHELYYYDVLVNVEVLDAELRAALGDVFDGIIYATADNELRVLLTEETFDWADAVDAVVEAHDPDNLTPDQLAAAKVEATAAEADAQSVAIPGWASWTEQRAINYITANVTDLASAKVVLVAMARMLVALRNKTWPHLQD